MKEDDRMEAVCQEKIFYLHKVQYYETDQMAVVHHSNYIRWFEEARLDFLVQAGYGMEVLEGEGIVSPVIDVSCRFKSMSRFGETVRILVSVRAFNGVKLLLAYKIYDVDSGELRAEGESGHCFLNMSGKPVSVKKEKPEFYRMLTAFLQE